MHTNIWMIKRLLTVAYKIVCFHDNVDALEQSRSTDEELYLVPIADLSRYTNRLKTFHMKCRMAKAMRREQY